MRLGAGTISSGDRGGRRRRKLNRNGGGDLRGELKPAYLSLFSGGILGIPCAGLSVTRCAHAARHGTDVQAGQSWGPANSGHWGSRFRSRQVSEPLALGALGLSDRWAPRRRSARVWAWRVLS